VKPVICTNLITCSTKLSFVFVKPVICTNLIRCSTKLSLHAAECGRYVLSCWGYDRVYIIFPLYISMKEDYFIRPIYTK